MQALVAYWFARTRRISGLNTRRVVLASFVIALVLSRFFVALWRNSGDEYGYFYLAKTLSLGRLWNPPAPDADLFETYWIFEKLGKRLSQYPPGWSVFLVPFVKLGFEYLASPLALLASGVMLASGLRRLGATAQGVATAVALTLPTPFALFNGASLFPMAFVSSLVLAVIWLQIREDAVPCAMNRVMIGLAFSAILTVRYETFGVLLVLFCLDQLLRRPMRFLRELPAFVIGAAPLTVLFLGYNGAITGNPLLPTFSWVRSAGALDLPAMAQDSWFSPMRGLSYELVWFSVFCGYGGLPLLVLYCVAFARKIRARAVRFFDLVPLAAVAFFFFVPDLGGHQFGPRYLFFGFAPMALTVAALRIDQEGWTSLRDWRVHGPSLAAVCIVGFLATALVVGPYFRLYANARQRIYNTTPPSTPAVVLIPSREFKLAPWQRGPYLAQSRDFTRNSMAYDDPVLYARGDILSAGERACALTGRKVYLWEEPGALRPFDCTEHSDHPAQ